jgi:ADP-glucose pyrophosphorylase
LGLGDPRLPHWLEEPNVHYKYLELSKNELVSMFLSVMDAILDKEETNNFSTLSIDWDNEIKKFTNKPTEIKQDNNGLPQLK